MLRTNYLPEVIYSRWRNALGLEILQGHKSNLTRLRVEIQVKIKGYLLRKGVKYGRIWNEKALSKLARG